jgi:hypothetical protein
MYARMFLHKPLGMYLHLWIPSHFDHGEEAVRQGIGGGKRG